MDVGTGSGKWVIEVADQLSSARVCGIDISPIQPTDVPVNAEFMVMDLTDGLDFYDGSTDLVHSRQATSKSSANIDWCMLGLLYRNGRLTLAKFIEF